MHPEQLALPDPATLPPVPDVPPPAPVAPPVPPPPGPPGTLPDDLTSAGMRLYPNGVYINSGLPTPGVSFALATLELNIAAARHFVARRAQIAAAEAERSTAEAAKPKRRRKAVTS